MFGKVRVSRWLVAAVTLALAECAGLTAGGLWTAPAQAQGLDQRFPYLSHRPRPGGFFQELFGPYHPRGREYEQPYRQAPRVDHTRPPPPPKAAKAANATTIVVMGDDMAVWLAYGLEDAFADAPEIAVVRKDKLHSGLLRYEAKSDLDWWHVARDILTQEKANYAVMMLGLHDRENIRESDLAKEAEKQQAEKQAQADKQAAEKKQDNKGNEKTGDKNPQDKKAQDKKDQADKEKAAEAEKPKPKPPNGIIEFHTDRWATVYSKRIDETIAALKSKGVPVFWVGLPAIRGTKSTADASYLNDLYRVRAERAGIVFIDVWDGFVDDGGKFSSFGPDYEGQMRRLRSSDGVFFTKYGARKLAHYVEREIRRYMSNRSLQVTLPTGPVAVPNAGKSNVRPVTGPVVPLTGMTGAADELLGGAGNRPGHGDTMASRVLVNGEPASPQPGRADDFAWPPGSEANRPKPPTAEEQKPGADQQSSLAPPAAPGSAAAGAKRPVRIITPGEPSPPTAKPEAKPAQTDGKPAEAAQNANAAKPPPPAEVKPVTHSSPPPRRRHFDFPFPNPFGWLR